MKITIDLDQDETNLTLSVFKYLSMPTDAQQQIKVKQVIMDWVQKWLYEMARKAKDKSGKY